MAQTKRKRRSKHRGNAAGTIETRGRPSTKLTVEERKRQQDAERAQVRAKRDARPPTWRNALTKAAVMAALLFVLTRVGLFGKNTPIGQSAALCLFAVVFYTPLAFMTDKWVYNRQQRRQAGQAGR